MRAFWVFIDNVPVVFGVSRFEFHNFFIKLFIIGMFFLFDGFFVTQSIALDFRCVGLAIFEKNIFTFDVLLPDQMAFFVKEWLGDSLISFWRVVLIVNWLRFFRGAHLNAGFKQFIPYNFGKLINLGLGGIRVDFVNQFFYLIQRVVDDVAN